jgi:pimeloyl-ACP methyl ester carboxylesterase
MRERYIAAHGVRLFCVEAGPAGGPLVLFVHGWPEFWWSWRHQLPAVAAAGFHAVAVDLPGYGRSDKPDVTYDEAWVNSCLAEAIVALGHDEAVLVGHDWGGLLVWPFARRFPERTRAVVGVNTPDLPRPDHPTVELMRKVFGHNLYIVQFQERGPAEWFLGTDVRGWLESVFRGPATRHPEAFPDEVIDRFAEQFSVLGSITPPLEYYRNMDRNWALAAELPETVEVPALMVTAEHDPVLRPELAVGMEARVPNLRTVLIEDCGHWTQQEQPERFNEVLLSFLTGG